MNSLYVKAAVRERDGYKCVDCGKTSEQAIEETGRELHVHRLEPGSEYALIGCVTVCKKCHGIRHRKGDARLGTLGLSKPVGRQSIARDEADEPSFYIRLPVSVRDKIQEVATREYKPLTWMARQLFSEALQARSSS